MNKWYAVYTKPGAEKKVKDQLIKNGFQAYCPFQEVKKNRESLRGKAAERPVFPNYVFVNTTREKLSSVSRINNVLTLVYWLSAPLEIRDIEVEMIQRFIGQYSNVDIEYTGVRQHEMVRVISEPFMIEEEEGVMFVKNQLEKVVLPSLGLALVNNNGVRKGKTKLKSLNSEQKTFTN